MDASTGLVVNILAQKHQMRPLLLQEKGPVVAVWEKWRMYIMDFFLFCM